MFDDQERLVLLVVVAVFFAFMIGYAYYFYRKIKTYDDYNVAGRSTSLFPLILTIVGTATGGSQLLGFMTKGYENGLGQIWLPTSFTVTGILFILFFVKRIRKLGEQHNMVSIGDYTALRYGEAARLPTLLCILCAYCAVTGMQFVAIATILNLIFGLNLVTGILIGGILLTIKTYFGGLKAVIWSDAILGTIQTLGIFLLLAIVLYAVGGWGHVVERAQAMNQEGMFHVFHISKSQLFVYFLTIGAYQFVRQDLWQRFWAAKDVKTSIRGYWVGIIIGFLIGAAIVVIGVLGKVGLSLNDVNPQLIYYGIIQNVLPLPLIAVMIIGLLATVISCADSFFIAGASSIVNDIIKPRLKKKANPNMLKYSRLSVIIMSVISLLLALYIPHLVQMWVLGSAMLVSGLLAPVLIGLVWKGATNTAGVVSMWLGLGIAVIWQVLGHPFGIHPVFIGLPLSICSMFAVSLVTRSSQQGIESNSSAVNE